MGIWRSRVNMNIPGKSCLGCVTLFFGSIFILAIVGWMARYSWLLAIIAGVAALIWYNRKSQHKKHVLQQNETYMRESAEKIILRIAARNQGFVTPMEVVLESDMTLEQAGDILNQLHKKGYATLRVADNGSYVYQLNGLLTPQQKRDSEQV